MIITSAKNIRIKQVLKLRESRERKRLNQFSIEGARELARALERGFALEEIYYCKERLSKEAQQLFSFFPAAATLFEVSTGIFEKLVMREETDGILGVLAQKHFALADLPVKNQYFIIALEGVEKPGNFGAILRTADGVGVDALIIIDGSIDQYNPNVIRASLGTVFSVPIIRTSSNEAISFFQTRGIRSLAATPHAQNLYFEKNLQGSIAILFGSESDGLTEFWLDQVNESVKIPMNGIADSLNVSVSAAVIMYEAYRQRNSD